MLDAARLQQTTSNACASLQRSAVRSRSSTTRSCGIRGTESWRSARFAEARLIVPGHNDGPTQLRLAAAEEMAYRYARTAFGVNRANQEFFDKTTFRSA
jgi:hypothetical protein